MTSVIERIKDGMCESAKVYGWVDSNDNKTVYVMPAQAFGDPTLMMPVYNKAFSGQ